MQEGYTALSEIDRFGGGAISSRLEVEMENVAKNIMDTNTSPKATRSIVIKLTIKPSEDRSAARLLMSVDSKLAPREPVAIPVTVGLDENNRMVVAEKTKQLPGQFNIYGEEVKPKVIAMNGGKS